MFRDHQELSPTGEVYAAQTVDLPSIALPADPLMAAAEAGWLYWKMLNQLPLVDVQVDGHGAVAIWVPSLLLLSFGPPTTMPDGAGIALRYPIWSGVAVHPEHRRQGYLQLSIAPGRVAVTVDGYYPSLAAGSNRGAMPTLYKLTQSAIHARIARRFLPVLARRFSSVEDNGLIRV
jgi:hypothetical protein